MSFLCSWLARLGFGRRGGSPDLLAIRLREAQRAFVANDVERADGLAASALRLRTREDGADPDDRAARSTLFALRGGIAVRRNRLPDARGHFTQSLAEARASGRKDATVAALLNLIDVHTRCESFADAREMLEEAAQAVQGTQFVSALGKLAIERGVVQTRAGHLPDAIISFDLAIDLCPDWPFPWYQRAWARLLIGDTGGALEDYKECAARKSVFFTVQREIRCLEDVAAGRLPLDVYRAFCFVRDHAQRKPDAVDGACGRMLEQAPDFAPAHLLRAELKLVQRDLDAALDSARKALRHDPDPDTAAAALVLEWNISRQKGDEEATRLAAERLESAYRDHPAATIVQKIRESPKRDLGLRWTFALDGTLHFEEVDPRSLTSPGRNPPPLAPPGSES